METSNSGSGRRSGAESPGSNHHKYAQNGPSATQQPSGKAPFPWNLTRFYNMSEDSPWVPQGIVASIPPDTQSGQHLSGSINFQGAAAFQNYRSTALQSECDTTNDDSGYGGSGAGAPYSIENTSVYEDDQNPEAHNAAHLFEAFHLGAHPPPPTWAPPRPTPSVTTGPASGDLKHYCAKCETWLRTRSELNKHNLRHSKPFACKAPGCNRTEGFSTKNDLDRHKRSVHSDLSVSGPRYVCRLGQCSGRDNPKLWPRADNFRSHLRRIHHRKYAADEDLGEYIYRQPPLGEDLEGVGGSALSYMNINQSANTQKSIGHPFSQSFPENQPMATNSRHGIPQLQDDLDSLDSILQNSTSTSSEKGPAGSARVQDVDDAFMQPELLHGTGQGSLQSGRAPGVQMTPQSRRYPYTQQTHESIPSNCELSVCNDDDTGPGDDATESSEHGDECDSALETVSTHPKGLRLNQSRTEQPDVKMRDVVPEQSSSAIRSSSDTISINLLGLNKDPERVLEYLKTLPKELLKSALNEDVENSKATCSTKDSVNQKTQYPCPECAKKFARPCELKKHLKRHEKPYGCTFPDCSKAFGSKNDWKRHESSQHWQLERWKCEDNKANSQQLCDKVCHRRESFKHHLTKEHLMSDTKQIEEKLDKCRIGRHCDTRFWCGFCVEIVEITDEGVNAWTKRCDHIDDHFSGRDGKLKRNIIEWKQMETENQKRDASTQSSTEESSSTSDSGMSSPLKRKLSADAEINSRKKQRQDVVYMWQCCRCNEDINLKTTTMCIECSHQKCSQNCVVSKIIHRPDS